MEKNSVSGTYRDKASQIGYQFLVQSLATIVALLVGFLAFDRKEARELVSDILYVMALGVALSMFVAMVRFFFLAGVMIRDRRKTLDHNKAEERFKRYIWKELGLENGYCFRDPRAPSGTPSIKFEVFGSEETFSMGHPIAFASASCTGTRVDGTKCSEDVPLLVESPSKGRGGFAVELGYYCTQCEKRLSLLPSNSAKERALEKLNKRISNLRRKFDKGELLIKEEGSNAT